MCRNRNNTGFSLLHRVHTPHTRHMVHGNRDTMSVTSPDQIHDIIIVCSLPQSWEQQPHRWEHTTLNRADRISQESWKAWSSVSYAITLHLIVIINSLNPVHTTTLILLIVVVIMTVIIMTVHVCRNIEVESANRFTREGVEQIEEAVRERHSAGDMTKLELFTPPAVKP